MQQYSDAVAALKKIISGPALKGKDKYLNQFTGVAYSLASIADAYGELGYGRHTSSIQTLRNKVISLSNKVESGKITQVSDLRAEVKAILARLQEFDPMKVDTDKVKEKAGIKDQSKMFEGLTAKRVKLFISPKEAFKLERAPLLLLFRNKLKPAQKKFLDALNATFYQGTGGVSIPSVPILVLNKDLVDAEHYEGRIKAILKGLKRPDLVVFTEFAAERRNCVAFMVFEPKLAEFISVGIFDQCLQKELMVS